jgi:hypothetical protein
MVAASAASIAELIETTDCRSPRSLGVMPLRLDHGLGYIFENLGKYLTAATYSPQAKALSLFT